MIVPKSKGSLYRKMIRNSLRCIRGLQVGAEIANCKSEKARIRLQNSGFRLTVIAIALNFSARLTIQQFCNIVFRNLIER